MDAPLAEKDDVQELHVTEAHVELRQERHQEKEHVPYKYKNFESVSSLQHIF